MAAAVQQYASFVFTLPMAMLLLGELKLPYQFAPQFFSILSVFFLAGGAASSAAPPAAAWAAARCGGSICGRRAAPRSGSSSNDRAAFARRRPENHDIRVPLVRWWWLPGSLSHHRHAPLACSAPACQPSTHPARQCAALPQGMHSHSAPVCAPPKHGPSLRCRPPHPDALPAPPPQVCLQHRFQHPEQVHPEHLPCAVVPGHLPAG